MTNKTSKTEKAPAATIEDFFNKVVLAFSTNPRQGTASVYSNGVKVADWREKNARRPSLAFIRDQAQRHVEFPEKGNVVHEISLDWPHPEVLEEADYETAAEKPARPVGAANDDYDQDAIRINEK